MKKLSTPLVYKGTGQSVDKKHIYKQNNKFFFYYILKNFFFTKNYKSTVYTVLMGSKLFIVKNKEKSNYFIKKNSLCKSNLIKFIAYFNKKGLFTKHLLFVLNIYSLIYRLFLNFEPNDILNKDLYAYIVEFRYNLQYDKSLLDIKNLLGWVVS